MRAYLDMLDFVLSSGEEQRDERTGVGTLSWFGYQTRIDISTSFPLLTTKYVHFDSIVTELLWFLRGETNIRPLLLAGCRIWSDWPHDIYVKATGDLLTKTQFERRVIEDAAFALQWGDIGPCYGKQWRRWSGASGQEHVQLAAVIDKLKRSPRDRGNIMSGWNVDDLPRMALRPCHTLYQWKVSMDGRLDCSLYQRSADSFLGVPFNMASASLLTCMLAQVAGLHPGYLIHSFGDVHIYLNHLDQVRTQLGREPKPLPRLVLDTSARSIEDFTADSINLVGYEHWPAIKAPVAV